MNIVANLEKTAQLLPDQIEDFLDLIGMYDGTVITPVW
jgi:hypothetical protein